MNIINHDWTFCSTYLSYLSVYPSRCGCVVRGPPEYRNILFAPRYHFTEWTIPHWVVISNPMVTLLGSSSQGKKADCPMRAFMSLCCSPVSCKQNKSITKINNNYYAKDYNITTYIL